MGSPISMMAVDAGYSTQEVYNWVRQQNPYRVIAIKGVDKALIPLGSPSHPTEKVVFMKGANRWNRGGKQLGWLYDRSSARADVGCTARLLRWENAGPKAV